MPDCGVVLRVLWMAALATLVVSSAVADSTTPLLLRPPTPASLIPPEPLPPTPVLLIPSKDFPIPPGSLVCFIADVDTDGKVSVVATLHPSGVPGFDELRQKYLEDRRFSPATLDGQPVTVRLIRVFMYGPGDRAAADAKCSWTAYDAWLAASPHP